MTTLLDLLDTRRGTGRDSGSKPSEWLLGHLVATGRMTESGLGRAARVRQCGCGLPILAGLDDEIAALEASVDPVPIGPLGEMLARIEHRATFDLRREGKRWVLDYRDYRRITARPAGSQQRVDVVREHRCGSRPVSDPEAVATSFAETRPRLPAGSTPPF